MKKNTIIRCVAVICLTALFASTALAAPSFTSYDNQSFTENDGTTQLYNLTITDDVSDPSITAGELTITIPDSIAIIFDQQRTIQEVDLFGDAVDAGKVDEDNIKITNDDKTFSIPILANFTSGESFSISGLYVEGFNQSTNNSANLQLTIGDQTIANSKYLVIYTSSNDDNNEPESPTNVTIKQLAETVVINWHDPTDLDLTAIEVLRGKNNLPIDGNAYQSVPAGTEEFIDTDVAVGDTVKYILRATDGPNFSSLTTEISITIVDPAELAESNESDDEPTEPPATEDTDAAEDATSDESDETDSTDEDTDTGDQDDQPVQLTYEQEKELVINQQIITKDFDKTANKCEALVIIARVKNWTFDQSATADGFTDTPDWCKPYALKAKELGVVEGRTSSSLGLESDLNRYEVAVILARVLGATEAELTEAAKLDLYTDEIEDWAKGSVNWLNQNMVMTGYPDGTFGGTKGILKVELAVAIYRSLG